VPETDRSDILDRFLDTLKFDPYPFQEEALLAWYESAGGVLVSAPTGMGKTLIAEAAIFEALESGKHLYYTTPLIALTDQKFREFQDRAEDWGFPKQSIGLITGNRRVNPDARVRVVVAEILLNHLITGEEHLDEVSGVVMDEFHYFNDFERGIVWELSLALLPATARLMLLSATVGNASDFIRWASEQHGRKLQLVSSDERRVPLEFNWVGDKLLTEFLPTMVSERDEDARSPALVFCFNRDGCWDVAEKLKGASLIDQAARAEIEKRADPGLFSEGIGPKLRQMLIRGVGVHHAGVLPKYKQVVENLFLAKLIPFVVCTETLAAGINLPARSVVLTTLLKGKPREEKLIPGAAAHQMFGRAGRPQFDKQGYVFALAHDDDVKIEKWRKKYEQIDPNSKDPGIMRARKDMERKKPSRRKTVQYWTEGQLGTLIKSKPASLASRSMIPYQVLIYLLTKTDSLGDTREFLSKRFNSPDRLEKFQDQLDHMINNLAAFGYLTKSEDGDHVTLDDKIHHLTSFRSVDPLYGEYLVGQLARANLSEKTQALESVLPLPPAMEKAARLPFDLEPGPLENDVLKPTLLKMGLALAGEDGRLVSPDEEWDVDYTEEDRPKRPLMLPEMLKMYFDAKLATPEAVFMQPKWVAGGLAEFDGDFHKFTRARNLSKNEGLVLRHLLRLVILAGEFLERSGNDPDYETIGAQAATVCQGVDPSYTDHFLAAETEAKKLAVVK